MGDQSFMNDGGPRAGGDRESGQKPGKSILQYVSELMRLDMIREAVIGKEPLSRGTRDTHFVESWLYAVSKEDTMNDPKDPAYRPHIRLARSIAMVRRMRELSPHDGGKHIEIIRDLLATQPNNITLVGSPYDVAPPGPFDKAIETVTGRKQEDRIRYH